MTNYVVSWQINIEADTPRRAAELALVIQRDRDSIATQFDVREDRHLNDWQAIDLGTSD